MVGSEERCRKPVLGVRVAHSRGDYARSCLTWLSRASGLTTRYRTILLYVHRSEVAYLGRGQGGRGRKSEGSIADTARKRPERPWTAARTMEVLRQCPLAIAQRLVLCAIAVSTAVLGRVTRTMSVALLLRNNPK